jgi:diadenylate cyclase
MGGFSDFLSMCWNLIQTIEPNDIIDIAIVAYLIYKLITFVRKTSSANVIKGIVFLVGLLWLSSILDLHVIEYLLGATFELGFLALIVLFQPEIRRFLEQFGSSNLKGIFGGRPNTETLEVLISQLVLACSNMSATRTGALIAIEREITLDSYAKTGTFINAEPAAELLKNIFFHNSPLHDGAVIIKDCRVASAACMLPLSNNTNLSRDLGMRHRAGVGMSERSDAVVVIVSEETGSISVAVDGMLKRHLAPETFEKLLRNELIPKDDKYSNKLTAFITRLRSGKSNGGKTR